MIFQMYLWQLQNLSGMNYVSVVATLLVVVFFQVGPGMKSMIFNTIIVIVKFNVINAREITRRKFEYQVIILGIKTLIVFYLIR